jgi:hypothetical protein
MITDQLRMHFPLAPQREIEAEQMPKYPKTPRQPAHAKTRDSSGNRPGLMPSTRCAESLLVGLRYLTSATIARSF